MEVSKQQPIAPPRRRKKNPDSERLDTKSEDKLQEHSTISPPATPPATVENKPPSSPAMLVTKPRPARPQPPKLKPGHSHQVRKKPPGSPTAQHDTLKRSYNNSTIRREDIKRCTSEVDAASTTIINSRDLSPGRQHDTKYKNMTLKRSQQSQDLTVPQYRNVAPRLSHTARCSSQSHEGPRVLSDVPPGRISPYAVSGKDVAKGRTSKFSDEVSPEVPPKQGRSRQDFAKQPLPKNQREKPNRPTPPSPFSKTRLAARIKSASAEYAYVDPQTFRYPAKKKINGSKKLDGLDLSYSEITDWSISKGKGGM